MSTRVDRAAVQRATEDPIDAPVISFDVLPVHQVLPGALARIIRRAPLTPEKVAFAWRTAVGAAVAQATTVTLRNGLLRVATAHPAWQREIERSAGIIRTRLAPLLGDDVVRTILVVLDEGPVGG